MKIIVTGSLGHIGQPLTRELVEKGHTVTVISSKKERQKDIESLGATAATGSLEDADFLNNTFTGADALFAMMPPNFEVRDIRAYYQKMADIYVQAIHNAGIKRTVLLSSYGAHLDKGTGFILGAHDAEVIFNKLKDVSVTYLRPGYFYYNLYNFAGMIKGAGFIGANYGGNDNMVLVAPADIATAAAEELTKSAAGKSIRYVVSDERTCSEIAKVLGVAINKPGLQWTIISDEQMRDAMENNGIPPRIASLFVELGDATHSGILQEDYVNNKPANIGKIKLEDFAKEFARAFK